MRKDGTHVRRLTNRSGEGLEPSYSPNGHWIAFVSGPVRKTALFIMHPDGTGLRKLTGRNINPGHPTWAPSGRWIVFNSHYDKPNGRIFVIRPNGDDRRRLTRAPRGAEDFEPAFSPNGHLIAFTSFGPRRSEGPRRRHLGDAARRYPPAQRDAEESGVRGRRDLATAPPAQLARVDR